MKKKKAGKKSVSLRPAITITALKNKKAADKAEAKHVTPATAAETIQHVQHIPLSLLIPTPDNKRPIDEKGAEFKALLDSVRANGVQVPVIARLHPTLNGKFDLRAGARRLRAAEIAKLKTIPAIIREMTDEEAADITFVENHFRENLTAIQTAEQLAALLEQHGGDHQAVASILGKDIRWMHRVANVGANLSKAWIAAMTAAENPFALWTLGHLELIARYDAETQDRLLQEIKDDLYDDRDDRSVEQLRRDLESDMRVLKTAAWGMDELLEDDSPVSPGGVKKKMMPCKDCPKQTGFKPMLFDVGGKKDKGDMCLDSACWKRKCLAATKKTIEKSRVKYPNLVLLASPYRTQSDIADTKLIGNIEDEYKYVTAKKTDKKAVPCMKIGNGKTPQVSWMKKQGGASSGSSSKPKASGPKTLAEKKDTLNRKRWNSILKGLRKKLDETTLKDITPEDKVTALIVLVAEFSTSGMGKGSLRLGPEEALRVPHFVETEDYKDTLNEVWDMTRDRINSELAFNGPITQTPDEKITTGEFVAWLIGADIDELMKLACEEFPVPRAWGKQTPTQIAADRMTQAATVDTEESDENDDDE